MMNGPNQDGFAALMSSHLHNDITSFVSAHYLSAKASSEPTIALKYCFKVTKIGIHKAKLPAQHESLLLWVRDDDTLLDHEFVIERIPSDQASPSRSARFERFSQDPNSQDVLESIMASSVFSSTDDDTIPLLPLTNRPQKSIPLQPPIVDRITASLVKAAAFARTCSQSSSPQHYAHDSITGRAPGTLREADCIRVFQPVGLSIFDAALLARVVHDNAPIYGLFDNHCYMFASVIFDSIVQLYSTPGILDPPTSASRIPFDGPPAPTPEVEAPQNANLIAIPCPEGPSDQAGCWSGLLVLDPLVRGTIVNIVVNQFRSARTYYFLKLST
jgi:hypothetical protein